jgi:hypothetical protein
MSKKGSGRKRSMTSNIYSNTNINGNVDIQEVTIVGMRILCSLLSSLNFNLLPPFIRTFSSCPCASLL